MILINEFLIYDLPWQTREEAITAIKAILILLIVNNNLANGYKTLQGAVGSWNL